MDARNILETMKSELKVMRKEQECMEALLVAAITELQEMNKRIHAEYQAMKKFADELLEVFIQGTQGEHSHQENTRQNLDEVTKEELLNEAMREYFITVGGKNGAQTRGDSSRADGDINGVSTSGSGTDHQSLDAENKAPENGCSGVNIGGDGGGSQAE